MVSPPESDHIIIAVSCPAGLRVSRPNAPNSVFHFKTALRNFLLQKGNKLGCFCYLVQALVNSIGEFGINLFDYLGQVYRVFYS